MASIAIRNTACCLWMVMIAILVMWRCEGKEYLVGDSEDSWTLPLPSSDWLNRWARNHRFKIGDRLIWKYNHKSESVLQVKEEHYTNCYKYNPIEAYNDAGDIKVELNRSGSFYFISGKEDHCDRGLKLHVKVISAGHGGGHSHPPSPSPPSSSSPSPSPASTLSPSPATAPAPDQAGGAAGSLEVGLMGMVMGVGALWALV